MTATSPNPTSNPAPKNANRKSPKWLTACSKPGSASSARPVRRPRWVRWSACASAYSPTAVFAVTAQSALSGLLSPLRNVIAGWWTVEPGARDVPALSGLGHAGGLLFGAIRRAAALVCAHRQGAVTPGQTLKFDLGWVPAMTLSSAPAAHGLETGAAQGSSGRRWCSS